MKLEDDLREGKPVLGADRVIKKLLNGECRRVYMSSGCLEGSKINRMCKSFGVELVQLDVSNVELGVMCKKPFGVSALCFLK